MSTIHVENAYLCANASQTCVVLNALSTVHNLDCDTYPSNRKKFSHVPLCANFPPLCAHFWF